MKFTKLVIGAFALLLLLLPLRAVAESIDIDPWEWNYGEVEVGDTEDKTFTIESMGPDTELRIDGIVLVDNVTGAYEITEITPEPIYPIYLEVGETVEVVVTFAPEEVGLATASILIMSDAHNDPYAYVPLQGEGVLYVPTPEEMMEDLIDFFDEGVEEGIICGVGPGNSAVAKLRIFARMLDTADDLIRVGDDAGACDELERAYLRSDGERRPNDFIGCDGAPTVNAMIGAVMDALECE